jgi:FAD/FMN-containing dehydrogenase
VDEGKQLLAPLADFGEPIVAVVDGMPYTVLQTSFDAGNPAGERYYWKSQYLSGLPDDFLDALVDLARDLHGCHTIIGIEPLGGAHARVDASATAFAHRNVPFTLGIWCGWSDSVEDAANIAWTRRFYDAVKPFGAGVYVNYLGDDESDRIGEAYGGNLARLADIKRQWDPDNLFRSNQNIAPEAAT